MTTIKPGRYATNFTLKWWDRLSDTAREQAVAIALDLPAAAVEIVTDSDEEVDLASVWLVTDDHEQAIGHVTTETNGRIVVEVLEEIDYPQQARRWPPNWPSAARGWSREERHDTPSPGS